MRAVIAALAADEEVVVVVAIPKMVKRKSMTEATTLAAMANADDNLRTVVTMVAKASTQEVRLSVNQDVAVQVVPATTTIMMMKVVKLTEVDVVAIEKMVKIADVEAIESMVKIVVEEATERMVKIADVEAEERTVKIVEAVAAVVAAVVVDAVVAVDVVVVTEKPLSTRTAVEATT